MFFNFKEKKLPCLSKECPYEYDKGSDRDIEGMPFPKDEKDKRACPNYGHICPEFMKDLDFSVSDLRIRATIHCGFTAKDMLATGKWKLSEMGETANQIEDLLRRYDQILEKYPQDKYPKYYIWEV